jgi:sulfoxide reductase heme-binding subunit YedZ
LVLLTAVLVLGVATTARLELGSRWRFVVHGLHRNLSLLAVVFVAIHVLTAVLDPYAGITWRDALVPFVSSYRPLWLGLGVLALELGAALVVTGLTSRWIGPRVFRAVHWAAYACWPLALLHSLGTGSDVRTGWFYLLAVVCVGAAAGAFAAWRLLHGKPEHRTIRAWAAAATILGVGGLAVFAFSGPLRPGWAIAAGTPPKLVRGLAATLPAPAVQLPAKLDDSLQGSLVEAGDGYRIDLSDTTDPTLAVRIAIPSDDSSSATITVSRSGKQLCAFSAPLLNSMAGTCAGTAVQVQLQIDRRGRASAHLSTPAGAAAAL